MRPQYFTINRRHTLSNGLVFAGLGRGAHTLKCLDSSGYGNDGTLTNMDPPTDWVPDPTLNRWALDLDGSDDRVAHTLLPRTEAGTIASWVYIANLATTQSIWSITQTGNNNVLFTVSTYTDERPYVQSFNNVTWNDVMIGGIAFTASTWTHLAVTSNGSEYQIFLNGVPQSLSALAGSNTGRWTADLPAATYTCKSGYLNASYPSLMQGRISDLCVWDRALSTSEIQILANRSDPMYYGWLQPHTITVAKAPTVTTTRRSTLWVGQPF